MAFLPNVGHTSMSLAEVQVYEPGRPPDVLPMDAGADHLVVAAQQAVKEPREVDAPHDCLLSKN